MLCRRLECHAHKVLRGFDFLGRVVVARVLYEPIHPEMYLEHVD